MNQSMGWGEGREAKEGGKTSIIIADWHCHMVETNTTFVLQFKK